MRLILVRHYKTQINASERILGWGNSPPVSEWEKDLLPVREVLRVTEFTIDEVYSSRLERARQTALYYARHLGIPTVHHAAELNEVNYGELFGKSKRWVADNIPQYKTDPDFVFPGGESFRQMQGRSIAFVESLEVNHPMQTLLLVVHAGIIRGLLCHFLGLDYAPNLKHKIGHGYIGDLKIQNGCCVQYDELGRHSGFAKSGNISLPWEGGTSGLRLGDAEANEPLI